MAKKQPAGRSSAHGRGSAPRQKAVPRKKNPERPEIIVGDYSLEDILSEFRSAPAPQRREDAPARVKRTEAEIRALTAEAQEERGRKRPPEAPPELPGEAMAAKAGEGEGGEGKVSGEAEGGAPDEGAMNPESPGEGGREVRTEGYEDAQEDYAAPLPGEDIPAEETHSAPPPPSRPTPTRGGFFHELHGKLLGILAVAGMRRQSRRAETNAAPAEEEREMEPMDAARFYARQMPALRRRCQMAAAVTLLPLWIALAWALDIPIPGALGSNIRVAALVSMIAMLTVMLIGLDVITNGLLSLFRGCAGAEALIALGCVATAADCVTAAAMGKEGMPLPPCVICCVSITLSLLGSWYHCKTYRATFLTLARNPESYAVTSEQLLGRKDAFLIKSRQGLTGFVRRSEERDGCEQILGDSAPYMALTALLLALLSLLGNRSLSSLPHGLAMLLCVTAAWPGLFALPGYMADAALRFQRAGSAVAGWNGIREIGIARHLIITDSDLFPEGSVSMQGVHILEGPFTDQVVACTGSLMMAAGTELAGVFADLMERGGCSMLEVSDFTLGEGGVSGKVKNVNVHVGCAGYMYLLGVKIPDKLRMSDTVYTAFEHKLVGAFRLSYTADPAISAALQTLQRNRRKPIFAVRDFNVDQKMLREKFRCQVEEFEYPDMLERYAISQLDANGDRGVSALLNGGGLVRLVALSSGSRRVYWCGLACQCLTMGCALLGMGYVFLHCWQGQWEAVSSFRLLVYMLLWTLPCLLLGLFSGSKDEK